MEENPGWKQMLFGPMKLLVSQSLSKELKIITKHYLDKINCYIFFFQSLDWSHDYKGSPLVSIHHSYFKFFVTGYPHVLYDLYQSFNYYIEQKLSFVKKKS